MIEVKLSRRKIDMWLDEDGFNELEEITNVPVFKDYDGVCIIIYQGYVFGVRPKEEEDEQLDD